MLLMKCRIKISAGGELLCAKHRIENQSTILTIDITTEEVEEVVDMMTDAEVAVDVGMMIDDEGALHQDDEEAPHQDEIVVIATKTEDVAVADPHHDDDPDLDQGLAIAIDARLF